MSEQLCDCNKCRLNRGAFPYAMEGHDVCTKPATPSAQPKCTCGAGMVGIGAHSSACEWAKWQREKAWPVSAQPHATISLNPEVAKSFSAEAQGFGAQPEPMGEAQLIMGKCQTSHQDSTDLKFWRGWETLHTRRSDCAYWMSSDSREASAQPEPTPEGLAKMSQELIDYMTAQNRSLQQQQRSLELSVRGWQKRTELAESELATLRGELERAKAALNDVVERHTELGNHQFFDDDEPINMKS